MSKGISFIEDLLDRYSGRYFFVWVIASILLITKVIDTELWKWVTTAFLAGGAITAFKK